MILPTVLMLVSHGRMLTQASPELRPIRHTCRKLSSHRWPIVLKCLVTILLFVSYADARALGNAFQLARPRLTTKLDPQGCG